MAQKPKTRPTKKQPAKPASQTKPTPPPVVAATPQPPAPSAPAPAAVTKPRPSARTRRATASPAARRGSDLVRYLRIHAKKPYGVRGENALVALAKEVGHLGDIELGDAATVAEPK